MTELYVPTDGISHRAQPSPVKPVRKVARKSRTAMSSGAAKGAVTSRASSTPNPPRSSTDSGPTRSSGERAVSDRARLQRLPCELPAHAHRHQEGRRPDGQHVRDRAPPARDHQDGEVPVGVVAPGAQHGLVGAEQHREADQQRPALGGTVGVLELGEAVERHAGAPHGPRHVHREGDEHRHPREE